MFIANPTVYNFNTRDELDYISENEVPEIETGEILAHRPEEDEYEQLNFRQSLWTDDGRAIGDTSDKEQYYNVIQYTDVLDTVVDAAESRDLDLEGNLSFPDPPYKASFHIDFADDDATIYAGEGQDDPINLGMRIRQGQTGHYGVKVDVGAYRLICSNGMVAFNSDMSWEQTHQEPLQRQMIHEGMDGILNGVDELQARIDEAQEKTVRGADDVVWIAQNLGLDQYLDTETMYDSIREELEEPVAEKNEDGISLFTGYQAMTRALNHHTDIPEHHLDNAYDRAAGFLEYGDGVPHPDILGENAVKRRANQLMEDADAEEEWEGERNDLRDAMQAYGVTV